MARAKILVFQHVPFEPLGTLDPLLKNAGFRLRYVNFARDSNQIPSLDGYSALIVLGGPMNVDQIEDYPNLATEISLLREALDRGMSVLGICLAPSPAPRRQCSDRLPRLAPAPGTCKPPCRRPSSFS